MLGGLDLRELTVASPEATNSSRASWGLGDVTTGYAGHIILWVNDGIYYANMKNYTG